MKTKPFWPLGGPTLPILLLFLCAFAWPLTLPAQNTPEEEKNIAHVKRFFELYSKRDVNAIVELVSPDEISHINDVTAKAGPEVLKEGLLKDIATWNDFFVSVNEIFAKGDKVACRVTFHGIGNKKTGKDQTSHSIEIIRLKDGKSTEFWEADVDCADPVHHSLKPRSLGVPVEAPAQKK